MKIHCTYLYLFTLFIGCQLYAQVKIDTTWLNHPLEKYTAKKQTATRYKVTKEDEGRLYIYYYNADHRLESAFELGDKQIKNRKAEEITYLPDGKTRRVEFTWEVDMKRLVRTFYDTSDQLVGQAAYSDVNFEGPFYFKSGTQVKYYYMGGPHQIQTKDDDMVTEEKVFYRNGQLAEHFRLAKNLKEATSIYFNPEGKEVGQVEYLYDTKHKRKTVKQGEQYTYNTTGLIGKTIVENGQIKEKIRFTQPKNQRVLYLDNQPFHGTNYNIRNGITRKKTVYVEGEKIEETEYFRDGQVKSQTKGLNVVFYSQQGDTLGTGEYTNTGNKLKPHNGQFVTYFHKDIGVSEMTHYKDGIRERTDSYKPSKNHTSTFLFASTYNEKVYGKPYSHFYYSNGALKSTWEGKKNFAIITTFNQEGDTIGVFDERLKKGTKYTFIGNPGYQDLYHQMEVFERGRHVYFKKWYVPNGNEQTQDDLQVLYDYDYTNEAKTYDTDGTLMYTADMRDGMPWNGQCEQKQHGGHYRMYTYVDGVTHGPFTDYRRIRSKVTVTASGTMVNGKFDGVWKHFNASGLYKTETYAEGKRQGKTRYYKNGKVWKEDLYNDNITKSTLYNEKGKEICTLDYKGGRPYSGIGKKDQHYKTKHYKHTLTEYADGKFYKQYSYYNNTVYEVYGKQKGDPKHRVYFNAKTNKRYADITWNRNRKSTLDTVTYYNAKEKPILMGQYRGNRLVSGHILIQKNTYKYGPTLIHIVKNGNEVTVNVFDSQTNLLSSNYFTNNGKPLSLKAHISKNFEIHNRKFILSDGFQKFIRSKAFLKEYVNGYSGGLE